MNDWIPVTEHMPPAGRYVLATYLNGSNKRRRIIARWIPANTEEASAEDENSDYDEATDTFFTPEGWYEQQDNWEDYACIRVNQGEITHWMSIPLFPENGINPAPEGTRELIRRLRRLSSEMQVIGSAMDYYGGYGEMADHGKEMLGAAAIAAGWADHIEEELTP